MPRLRKKRCDECIRQNKVCNREQPCNVCLKTRDPSQCVYNRPWDDQDLAVMTDRENEMLGVESTVQAPGEQTDRASRDGLSQLPQQAQQDVFGDETHDNADMSGNQDATANVINPANRYSMQGGSQNPCMEQTYYGDSCMISPTYPCERDHGSNAHFVCHFCRQNPLLHDANEEEETIKSFRLYLCEQCTNIRSTLPELQLWEHERRLAGETRVRKMFTCSCHEELHVNWICRHHRVQRFAEIKVWGREKVRAFTNFNQGRFCADPGCRRNPPQSDSEIVMWNCAACEDLVMAYGNLESESANDDDSSNS